MKIIRAMIAIFCLVYGLWPGETDAGIPEETPAAVDLFSSSEFNGIEWGTHMSSIDDLIPVNHVGALWAIYVRYDETSSMMIKNNIEWAPARYFFLNKKLVVGTADTNMNAEVWEAMEGKYGEPEHKLKTEYTYEGIWDLDDLYIILSSYVLKEVGYDPYTKTAVYVFCKPILEANNFRRYPVLPWHDPSGVVWTPGRRKPPRSSPDNRPGNDFLGPLSIDEP